MENAAKVGRLFQRKTATVGRIHRRRLEVRGRGLMIGCELNHPKARELMKQSLQNGLIFNAVGDSILRFLPPLVVEKSQVDEAMAILDRSWEEIQ
jgi:acetylornithine/succinyldiaminopimelate/putrescine aminotransferase